MTLFSGQTTLLNWNGANNNTHGHKRLKNICCLLYTLNKSSKLYIVYICRVLQNGLIAGEIYPLLYLEYIIQTNNVVFVHFKSSCQYQFTRKTMASKAKWRLTPEGKRFRKCCVSLNLLSDGSRRWLKNVLKDYLHQNCPNFPCYMDTSGFPNGYP